MEKKWKSPTRRLLALFLCLAMVLPMFPQVARAVTKTTGGVTIAEGVAATGSSTTLAAAVKTGNKAIRFEQVTDRTLEHNARYLIMNAKTGNVMSYFATSESGHANVPHSIVKDGTTKAEGTYYLNGTTLYLDHSQRDLALWVLNSWANGSLPGMTFTYKDSTTASVLSNENFFKDFKDAGNDFGMTMQHGTDRIGYGIQLVKGRNGLDGNYWSTPLALSDSAHFPYLCVRSDTDPFKSEAGYNYQSSTDQEKGNYRMDTFEDGTFIIYYGANANDHRVLYCDENGSWGVRRYYTPPAGTDISGDNVGYFPKDQLDDDLGMLKMKLFKYVEDEGTTKTVSVSGYKTYTVTQGLDAAAVAAAIQTQLKVRDKDTLQYVSGSGNTAQEGYYYLDTSSLNTAEPGTYNVSVYYRNDAAGSKTKLCDLTITVKALASLGSNITIYTSKNSAFSDILYHRSGTAGDYIYTPLMLALTDSTVTVPVTLRMLQKDGNYIDTGEPRTITNVQVTYSGYTVGTVTLVIEDGTIEPHHLTYPAPGSVAYFKESTGENFANTGVANIQLSATGVPVTQGVDLIIMLDLSSSMGWELTGTGRNAQKYYTKYGVFNTSWTLEEYQTTRMWSMEKSLESMISYLKQSGVDARVAIADFGDIDHFEVGDSFSANGIGSILDVTKDSAANSTNWGKFAYLNGDTSKRNDSSGEGFDRTYDFPNHLNFVFGGADPGYLGTGQLDSGPYHTYHWKHWTGAMLSTKYGDNIDWDFMSRRNSSVYTGSKTYNANAFTNVNDLEQTTINDMMVDIRINWSKYLGTNYDIGLQAAYQLAHARREENIKKGEDRDIVCIFMSDGAAMQYNYFSGYARTEAWNQYLLGNTDTLLESGRDYANNFKFPTTANGYVDVSAAGRAKMHPDLKKTIETLGLTSNKTMYWSDLWAKIYSSNTEVTFPSNGAGPYKGAELAKRLIMNLTKPKKYYNIKPNTDEYEAKKADAANWYETYSPFWYFYNTEGKNWWAEAMKGDTGKLYPVINKYAKQDLEAGIAASKTGYNATLPTVYDWMNRGAKSPYPYNGDVQDKFSGETTVGLDLAGKDYISGVDGLGMKIYTIGFAQFADNKITVDTQETVLKNIATSEKYFMKATDTASLTNALKGIVDATTLGATQVWYTDTMGPQFDLSTEKTVVNEAGQTVTVNAKPYVQVVACEYQKNADGTYYYDDNAERVRISEKVLQRITFPGGKVAHLETLDENGNLVFTYGSDGTTKKDVWDDATGLIIGDRLWYNTNKTGTVGIDMRGDSAADFQLKAETFFWTIGNMPQYEIVLEYQVYLEGSLEGTLPNGTNNYDTNLEAPLHYIDFRDNNVTRETDTPKYPWSNQTSTKYTFYLTDGKGNYLKPDGTPASNINQAKIVTDITLDKNDGLTGNSTFTLKASDLWKLMDDEFKTKYELINPNAKVTIVSAADKQDHDLTTNDTTNTKMQQNSSTNVKTSFSNQDNTGLESITSLFAVKIRTNDSSYQYGHYLVNSNGQPIDENGEVTTVDKAVKVGTDQTVSFTVKGTDTDVEHSHTASEAFTNCGVDGKYYKIYDSTYTYTLISNVDKDHTLNLTGTVAMTGKTPAETSITNDDLANTTIYFPVQKLADRTTAIKYGYYRVDKNGKPLTADGVPTEDMAQAQKVVDATLLKITVANSTTDTVTPYTATAPTNWVLFGGSAGFTVTSQFANKTNTLDYTGRNVYYQTSTGYAVASDIEGISNSDLSGYTVWFPAYMTQSHTITVKENFYLVDDSGNPLNGYTGLLTNPTSSDKTVGADESFPFDGTTTFNGSGLDKDLFELYATNPGATVDAYYDSKTNDITTTGDATVVVKDNKGSTKVTGVPADEVDENVVFYAVKLKNLATNDTVVLDYGLGVNIDVLSNDLADLKTKGQVVGVANSWSSDYAVPTLGAKYSFKTGPISDTYGKISADNNKVVYTPFTMKWDNLDEFTYTAKLAGTAAGDLYYYGKVTVIPATTIYFEDNFKNDGGNSYITYTTYDAATHQTITSKWEDTNAMAVAGTQKDDRPGDAAQIYGMDSIYTNMGQFSMGSSKKVNVNIGNYSTAKFDFTGTGFDVLSMISGETGVIMVTVYKQGEYDAADLNKNIYKSAFVDTYYGYTYVDGAWVPALDASKATYQVPAIKITGLEYGTYTAVITCDYMSFMDHNSAHDGYDLYLDAIRIYDPANDGKDNTTIQNAYIDDGEGWPEYFELRNLILSTDDLAGKTSVSGVVFLDRASEDAALSVMDYKNFGPNNELYLAPGQSIAFNLNVTASNLDEIHLAMKSVNGTSKVKFYNLDADGNASNVVNKELKTASDLYYDITKLNNGIVVVSNIGTDSDAILSLTNVKVTYTSEHTDGLEKSYFDIMKEVVDNLGNVIGSDSSVETTTTPKLIAASLSLNDEVFVNYYFSTSSALKKDGNKYTNAGLLLWGYNPGAKNRYEDAETVVSGALSDGGNYVIQTPGIPAKKLGDTIYARVYIETSEGKYSYSDVVSYSPKNYAYNMLKNSNDTKLKQLMVAMLNYGTAAQEYFGYNDDIWLKKPNADLTNAQKNLIGAYDANTMVNTTVGQVNTTAISGHTTGGFTKIVPSVSFDGAFAINYYFEPSEKVDGNVSFYYWTSEQYDQVGADLSQSTGKLTLINAGDTTEYRATVTGIAAKNMKDPIYIAAVYSDGTTSYYSGVYAYSISYYCKTMADADRTATVNLAEATAVYGYYAEQYFG